jgi:cytochrome P450
MALSYDPNLILGSLVSAALVSYLLKSLWTRRQDALEAERLGCLPPPRFPTNWPLGIGIVRNTATATREMRGLEYVRNALEAMGGTLSNRFRIGFVDGIFTADEEIIQAVLSKQFDDFEIGDIRRDLMYPLLGDGIFTQDGPAWRHSRALLRPAFARRQVSDLELEERHVGNLMTCLPVDLEADGWTAEVDLQPLFFRFTLDSATEFLFGGTVNSQLQTRDGGSTPSSDGPSSVDFGTQFDIATEGLGIRADFVGLGQYIWPRGFHQACLECHRFVDSYIQQQLARVKDRPAGDSRGGKYDFFEALAQDVKDPVELRYQLLNILLAGRDTTAGLLSFIFYSLARDPARYQKLREIVVADFGTYDEDPRERMSFESLKACKYLQYVIDETLRLYPIVPGNSRRAIKNTTLPRGGGPDGKSRTYVRKGTLVSYSVYIMHRRKDIWGDDVDDFRPERWEGRKVGWEYLPVRPTKSAWSRHFFLSSWLIARVWQFNGGPRICLGQQFALTKAAYVTARLVQRFDKIENLDSEPVKHRVALTLSSGTGVKVKLHEAQGRD